MRSNPSYLQPEEDQRHAGYSVPDVEVPVKKAPVFSAVEPTKTGGSTLDAKATEEQLANVFLAPLPPLKCVSHEWYFYIDGCWRRTNREVHRPRAMAIQHESMRTARKAEAILNHVQGEAQIDESLFRSFYMFDVKGDILINVANGVLRVSQSGKELLPHNEKYMFRTQLAASYDPVAVATTFESVLQAALPEPADIELFRVFIGSLLYPDNRHEAVLVSYGAPGTGKSTLSESVQATLGEDLVSVLSLPQICDPKSFHLSRLQTVAVNIHTELDALPVLDGSNFKLIASGERIGADRKFMVRIEFEPTCKLWFLSNHLPKFAGGTGAELRRLRFLKFDKKPAQPDASVKARAKTETSGILNLMLDGLLDLLQLGHVPQGGAESAHVRERFSVRNDPVTAFVTSECELQLDARAPKTELFERYTAFCEKHDIPKPDDKTQSWFFGELYTRYNLEPVRSNYSGKRMQEVKGILLRDKPETET